MECLVGVVSIMVQACDPNTPAFGKPEQQDWICRYPKVQSKTLSKKKNRGIWKRSWNRTQKAIFPGVQVVHVSSSLQMLIGSLVSILKSVLQGKKNIEPWLTIENWTGKLNSLTQDRAQKMGEGEMKPRWTQADNNRGSELGPWTCFPWLKRLNHRYCRYRKKAIVWI